MNKLVTIVLSGAVTAAWIGAAFAQQEELPADTPPGTPLGQPVQAPADAPIVEDVDPNRTVLERSRPDFNPLGIRAGSYLIFPSIGVLGEYDDNVFATDEDEDDDYSVSLLPEIRAESQWSRSELNFEAFGDFGFFLEETDSNYEDFGFETNGTYDINRSNELTGIVSIERDHDPRDDPDSAGGAGSDVTQFWDSRASLGYRYAFNRYFLRPSAAVRRLGFENAGDVSNDERDRTEYFGNLRFGVQVSPRFDVFGQGRVIRSVRDTSNFAGIKRDNTRYIGTVGTDIDITGVIFGEVQAGYEFIEFDEDELDSEQNPFAELGLTWNVTRLTSLLFDGRVAYEDTSVVVDGESASTRLEQQIGVEVQHELLRNLILEANGRYERDDFEGVDRTDNDYLFGAGVTYLLNRNVSLIANYNFSKRDSDENENEFTRNIFRVGVNVGL